MALKVNVTDTRIGVAFPEAYVRVTRVNADKELLRYDVETFATAAARIDNKQPVARHKFTVQTDNLSGDLFPAVYADLKARSGFGGAEDC